MPRVHQDTEARVQNDATAPAADTGAAPPAAAYFIAGKGGKAAPSAEDEATEGRSAIPFYQQFQDIWSRIRPGAPKRSAGYESADGSPFSISRFGRLERYLSGTHARDGYFKLSPSRKGEISDTQLRHAILGLVLEQGHTVLYAYKGNMIDPKLSARMQAMLAQMQQPGHVLNGYDVKVAGAPMEGVEPWLTPSLLKPWNYVAAPLAQRAQKKAAEAAKKQDAKSRDLDKRVLRDERRAASHYVDTRTGAAASRRVADPPPAEKASKLGGWAQSLVAKFTEKAGKTAPSHENTAAVSPSETPRNEDAGKGPSPDSQRHSARDFSKAAESAPETTPVAAAQTPPVAGDAAPSTPHAPEAVTAGVAAAGGSEGKFLSPRTPAMPA